MARLLKTCLHLWHRRGPLAETRLYSGLQCTSPCISLTKCNYTEFVVERLTLSLLTVQAWNTRQSCAQLLYAVWFGDICVLVRLRYTREDAWQFSLHSIFHSMFRIFHLTQGNMCNVVANAYSADTIVIPLILCSNELTPRLLCWETPCHLVSDSLQSGWYMDGRGSTCTCTCMICYVNTYICGLSSNGNMLSINQLHVCVCIAWILSHLFVL